jgi:hypothetical protein
LDGPLQAFCFVVARHSAKKFIFWWQERGREREREGGRERERERERNSLLKSGRQCNYENPSGKNHLWDTRKNGRKHKSYLTGQNEVKD